MMAVASICQTLLTVWSSFESNLTTKSSDKNVNNRDERDQPFLVLVPIRTPVKFNFLVPVPSNYFFNSRFFNLFSRRPNLTTFRLIFLELCSHLNDLPANGIKNIQYFTVYLSFGLDIFIEVQVSLPSAVAETGIRNRLVEFISSYYVFSFSITIH